MRRSTHGEQEEEDVRNQIELMAALGRRPSSEARVELARNLDADNLAVMEAATDALVQGWQSQGLLDVLKAASSGDLQASGTLYERIYDLAQEQPDVLAWLTVIESGDATQAQLVARYRTQTAWHDRGFSAGT